MPSTVRYNLLTAKQLPSCDGPKLRQFRCRDDNVKFINLLSIKNDRPSEHGHVFEVEIDGSSYALKVVCFPANSCPLIF